MRNRILEIAEEQMKAGGYGLLNFALISQALSTTRANLHYHFKNKETLAIEVTKRFVEEQHKDVQNLSAQYAGDFPKFISALEEFLWSHHECNGRVGACVCAQIIRQPEVPESLLSLAKAHFENFRFILADQVNAAIKSGTLRSDVDAKQVTLEAGCMLMGAAQMALITESKDHSEINGVVANWVKRYTP